MALKIPTSFVPYTPNHVRFIDLTGQRFGRLTVTRILGRAADDRFRRRRTIYWECLCDCGRVVSADGSHLRSGGTISCGCYREEVRGSFSRTHGKSKTKEYVAYCEAKKRCTYPKHNRFHQYGGRGIEFRFESFEQFFSVLGPKPSPKHSLNRIDNDGHYEPGNVEWATEYEQSRNQSTNHTVTVNGVTKIISDWARDVGADVRNIDARIRRLGWCEQCAVSLPKFGSCPHAISSRLRTE